MRLLPIAKARGIRHNVFDEKLSAIHESGDKPAMDAAFAEMEDFNRAMRKASNKD